MYGPSEFEGGVFSDEIEGGRASATIELSTSGMVALTSTGQRFGILYRDCQLDIGGATGRMVFCRTPDRKLTIFCEDRRFPAALDMESGGELAEQLAAARGQQFAEGVRWRIGLLATAILLLLVLIGGYYGVIAAAKASIGAVPVSVDIKIGKLTLESMELEGSRVTDKVIVEAVRKIVARMEPHSELKGLTFEVLVLDSPEVNAVCLAGGKILVFTGLLRKAKTAEQVAGVLSHEMAHAIKRHHLQRLTESLGFVVAIEVLIGDVGGLVALGVELGRSAALKSHSREHEMEADLVGVRLMHEAGIDPREMAGFMEMIRDEFGDIPDGIKWLANYPQFAERLVTIRGELAKLGPQQYRPFDIDWEAVQLRLDQLKQEDK